MDWLSAAIAHRHTFVIGEVTVTFQGDDAALAGPSRPGAEPDQLALGPDALRAFLRTSGDGQYRPLASARGLRPGWTVRFPARDLADYLEAVYPLAAAHIRMNAGGALRVVPLDDVLARQTGRYEGVASATVPQRAAVVRALCSQCVRVPIWSGQAVVGTAIPCPEACSVFIALCREVVVNPTGTDSARTPRNAGEEPAFAAFEDPANPLVSAVRGSLRP